MSLKFSPRRWNAGVIRRLAGVLVGAAFIWTTLTATASADTVANTEPELSDAEVTAMVLEYPKVSGWLERYPEDKLLTSSTFSQESGQWEVGVFSGEAGQLVDARVDDRSGDVVTVWVGPEVAWPLARGNGLGGVINRPTLWLAFCAFFLIGLADLRRPFSLRNLDLLGLLSFSAYLVFLNQGRVFAADLAAAASLLYLMARAFWIGVTNRPQRPPSFQAPVWLLVAGLVFLGGLRIGLNTEASGILDVGYAGVIGADRLVHAESPYGNFPDDTGIPCGPPNSEGQVADWMQDNGRCETANHLGDTYGPVNYHAYIPGLWLFGWTGKWDYLPAVHFTTILFDLLAMLGLAAVGYRFGRTRLAVTLAFAWAAFPFTQYVSSSNTNDSIMAALLIWGFWAATSPVGRGALLALASWTKFAALIVVPLWATYPTARTRRSLWRFVVAFGITTLLAFWVLFVTGDPLHEIRVFYERTFQIQLDRSSPFSLWDWGQYHAAGLPDLKWLQHLLQVVLVAGAVLLAVVPRRKTPLQLAAFTAALIMAFEFLLTHWAALYIVWFLPFSILITTAGDALRDAPISTDTGAERRAPPGPDDDPRHQSAVRTGP